MGSYDLNNTIGRSNNSSPYWESKTDKADKDDNTVKNSTVRNTSGTLGMEDFLQLIVEQLKNQDMSNPMDSSQMMNQLVQMATVSAMNTVTDVSMTTYAASLVGKEVTVAGFDEDGKIKEIVGTVTGAGLYGGQQVVFVNEETYTLSQIMAVGKIPKKEEPKPPDGEGDKTDPPDGEGDKVNPPDGEGDKINPPDGEGDKTNPSGGGTDGSTDGTTPSGGGTDGSTDGTTPSGGGTDNSGGATV